MNIVYDSENRRKKEREYLAYVEWHKKGVIVITSLIQIAKRHMLMHGLGRIMISIKFDFRTMNDWRETQLEGRRDMKGELQVDLN